MKVAVIGGSGLLGTDMVLEAKGRGWNISSPAHTGLDITDANQVREYCGNWLGDWIINCAAYVQVDQAESEPERAFALNSDAPHNLADACSCRLVHVSTDYVFDGIQNTPYTEDAEPNPLGVYAESKLQGEQRVLSSRPDSLIVRSAWLYGLARPNFPSKVLDMARMGKDLRLVADRIGSPTYTPDLAKGIADMIQAEAPGGVYHVVNEGEASWFDLCSDLLAASQVDANIEKASNSDYPTPAKRPMYSVLSTQKFRSLGLGPLPHWKDAVRRFAEGLSNAPN